MLRGPDAAVSPVNRNLAIKVDGIKYEFIITVAGEKLMIECPSHPDSSIHLEAWASIDEDGRLTLPKIAIRTKWNNRHNVPISAKQFLFFAIRFFEKVWKRPVEQVTAHWLDSAIWGDNYQKYMDARIKGSSEIDAARITWTGKVLGELGFSQSKFLRMIIMGKLSFV